MPTVLREAGLRLHFFSGDGHEPPHIHIDGHGRKAKIWLRNLEVAKNGGFSEAEMSRILRIVADHRENCWERGMTSLHDYPEQDRPVEAWCDPHQVHVRLADGREVVTPLWWYPRLLEATPAQRNTVELMLDGVHWPEADEDLSIDGMLRGQKAPGAVPPAVAAE